TGNNSQDGEAAGEIEAARSKSLPNLERLQIALFGQVEIAAPPGNHTKIAYGGGKVEAFRREFLANRKGSLVAIFSFGYVAALVGYVTQFVPEERNGQASRGKSRKINRLLKVLFGIRPIVSFAISQAPRAHQLRSGG